MNKRSLASILLVFTILAGAGWIDPVRVVRSAQSTMSEAVSASGETIDLIACGANQESYAGQLVMDAGESSTDGSPIETKTYPEIPQDRWLYQTGFSISTQADPTYWAKLLGSGWYLDWRVDPQPAMEGIEYWPMVRVHETCISPSVEEIRKAAMEQRGLVWIIGNEPDVIWQDNVTPDKFAIVYHELYTLIKSADTSAKIAVGGISQATPLRLIYLDEVLASYQARYHSPMPADWWTVHGYVLREEKGSWGVDIPPGSEATRGELREVTDHGNIEIFEQQLIDFRQWMDEHGYQQTPLALTEFGILMPEYYGFTPEIIADYLGKTFTWLSQATDNSTGFPGDGYHLVQKWAWFSLSDPLYSSADLASLPAGTLTLVGESFRDFNLNNGK